MLGECLFYHVTNMRIAKLDIYHGTMVLMAFKCDAGFYASWCVCWVPRPGSQGKFDVLQGALAVISVDFVVSANRQLVEV